MDWEELDKKAINVNEDALTLAASIDRGEDGCPLTLEGAIRHLLLQHPNMCRYRSDALDLLYCVLGTGIHWDVNGRLTDIIPDNYLQLRTQPPWESNRCFVGKFSVEYGFSDKHSLEELNQQMLDKDSEQLDAFTQVVTHIDEWCQAVRPGKLSWYPGWSICNLATVPINVQSDFQEGANETKRLITKSATNEDWMPVPQ